MHPHTHLPYTPSEFLCVDILWTPVSPKDTTMSPPQSNCWPTRFLLQCFRLLTMVPVVWQFNSCSITQRKRRWLLWRWYEVPLRLPPQRTRFTLGIHCMVWYWFLKAILCGVSTSVLCCTSGTGLDFFAANYVHPLKEGCNSSMSLLFARFSCLKLSCKEWTVMFGVGRCPLRSWHYLYFKQDGWN